MKLKYVYPLAGFVVLTVLIGYGFVIPRSCIAGINDLTIGFTVTIISACATYWIGLRNALRDVALSSQNCGEPAELRVRVIVQQEGSPVAPT